MDGQDLDAAEPPFERREDRGKGLRPRDERDRARRHDHGSGAPQPASEKPFIHRVRLFPEGVGRLPVMKGVERRVHDDEVGAPVGKPCVDPLLAGERDIRLDYARAPGNPGVLRKRQRLAGKAGHFRGTLDEERCDAGAAAEDGQAGGAGTCAETEEPAPETRGNGTCQDERIDAGAMPPLCGLHQMEAAPIELIDRVIARFRHGRRLFLLHFVSDPRIGQNPFRAFRLFRVDHYSFRQYAERALDDAHILVGDEAGNARVAHQYLDERDQDGVVGADKFDHDISSVVLSLTKASILFAKPRQLATCCDRAAKGKYRRVSDPALPAVPACAGAVRGVRILGVVVSLGESKRELASIQPLIDLTTAGMRRVNELILSRAGSDVEMIPEVANHLISSGGKRLRPMLTLAAAEMFGYRGDSHYKLAASVEFMHTATLLHDDVVDESALRRGRKTARMIWGNQASVLVGDFLLGQAFRMMVDVGSLDALDILSSAASIIAEGEVMQLAAAQSLETTEDEYLAVIKAKTAALFSAAAEVGPVVAAASREERTALRSYGINLGLAFQLIDDALDYGGNSKDLGKNVGDDFREGKVTLPVILSYRRGTAGERAFWKEAIEQGRSDDAALEKAIGLMTHHSTIADTVGRARHFGEIARDALAPLENTPQKSALLEVIDFCIDRIS